MSKDESTTTSRKRKNAGKDSASKRQRLESITLHQSPYMRQNTFIPHGSKNYPMLSTNTDESHVKVEMKSFGKQQQQTEENEQVPKAGYPIFHFTLGRNKKAGTTSTTVPQASTTQQASPTTSTSPQHQIVPVTAIAQQQQTISNLLHSESPSAPLPTVCYFDSECLECLGKTRYLETLKEENEILKRQVLILQSKVHELSQQSGQEDHSNL